MKPRAGACRPCSVYGSRYAACTVLQLYNLATNGPPCLRSRSERPRFIRTTAPGCYSTLLPVARLAPTQLSRSLRRARAEQSRNAADPKLLHSRHSPRNHHSSSRATRGRLRPALPQASQAGAVGCGPRQRIELLHIARAAHSAPQKLIIRCRLLFDCFLTIRSGERTPQCRQAGTGQKCDVWPPARTGRLRPVASLYSRVKGPKALLRWATSKSAAKWHTREERRPP